MNNEDKRFKQINRIAKPIQVNNNDQNVEQVIQKKEYPQKKSKKKLSPEFFLKAIIAFLSFACLGALVFLLYISASDTNTSSLKYNDAKTTNKKENFFISSANLSEEEYISIPGTYSINNFNFTLNASGPSLDININGKHITKASKIASKVGFVDDLVMFTVSNDESRTTSFYIVDTSGNVISNIYNYKDIDGMVLLDSNAVNYNTSSVILSLSRVNNNLIYNETNTPANVCNEENLFANSIETKKPVKINYSLEYLGNHKFTEPFIIYEESLDDYKINNNICN